MGPMIEDPSFRRLVEDAQSQPFKGWDFSFINGRIHQQEPSWDYQSLVATAIAQADVMLDMCTGGGEFLDSFANLPNTTLATEGYAPNVALAAERLAHRGITVVEVTSDNQLPLANDYFDLVINRHGAYSAAEVRRVTQNRGASFITQQVGSANALGINLALTGNKSDVEPTASAWSMTTAIQELEAHGFSILHCAEEYPAMIFHDVGALVYYLKAVPWQLPGFAVDAYRPALAQIHQRICDEGAFAVTAHRFLIQATA